MNSFYDLRHCFLDSSSWTQSGLESLFLAVFVQSTEFTICMFRKRSLALRLSEGIRFRAQKKFSRNDSAISSLSRDSNGDEAFSVFTAQDN